MRHENNYWIRRLTSSRLSRRRFVSGSAAVGAGAAGLALVGCGDDDDDGGGETPSPTTAGNGGNETTTPEPTQGGGGSGEKQQGGIRRASSANNTYDTFDADRSRFTPFAAIIGRTNLGIVHYKSFLDAELEAAFAESYEQPDAQTLTFKLRKGVKWHDKPPVDGRETTVEDMQFFIMRNKEGKLQDGTDDPNFYRKSNYASVESADVTDAETLTVKFSQPNPFFLNTLAGAYAKVQAPEAVKQFEGSYAELSADKIIGTGAFILTEFDAEGSYKFVRNEDFYDKPVYLDGQQYFPLFTDNAALQSAFEQKDIDYFTPRSVDVLNDLLSEYDGQLYNQRAFSANPMAGTYYGGAAPWSNENLIGAIFRSIDRNLMIQQLFQGSGSLSKNIPFTQAAFGITEEELITLPGYLEDRDKDLAEAKAMWEAGDGASLGDILIDIPDIWEGAYGGISETMTNMLSSALGNTFTAKIEPYSTITNKLINQSYGNGNNNIWYGWISDVQGLEPSLDLYTQYNSGGAGFFQFGVNIPEVDSLTNELVVELDVEKRKEITKDVERLLLQHWGAGIPHNVLQIGNTLIWNYLKSGEAAPFVNSHNEYRDSWLDQNDPSWQGRPA